MSNGTPTGRRARPAERGVDFMDLFSISWAAIRQRLCSLTMPAIVIAAVDIIERRTVGVIALAVEAGSPNAAIVGRHHACHLPLEGDPNLSLRHLAILASPLRAGARVPEVRFRIADLQTGSGFADELGRRLESVTVDGPAFIAVGRFALFLVPWEASDWWPEGWYHAWDCLPERVYADEQVRASRPRPSPATVRPTGAGAEPPDLGQRPVHAMASMRRTTIMSLPGLVRGQVATVNQRHAALGSLRVSPWAGGATEQTIALDQAALDRGLLLGRYERCDPRGLTVLSQPRISRVHMMVLYIDGKPYAIDTASTNGVFRIDCGCQPARILRLEDGVELALGRDLARVRWTHCAA